MFKLLPIFTFAALLTACGEESTSQIPTDPSTVFNLFDASVAKPGTNESFSASGTDSLGTTFEINVTIVDKGLTIFMSQSVRQTEYIVSLNVDNNGFITSSGSDYGDATTRASLFTTDDSGLNCTATTSVAVPDTALPGDFGTLSSLTCDDGTSETGSWLLQAATNGLANVIYTYNYYDQFGNSEGSEEATYTIDIDGNILAVQLKFSLPPSYEIILNGS